MDNLQRLQQIRIILSHTSHPGNIGATARAMKTMGLDCLYLINPKSFPDAEASARAASANDLLERAVVCQNLDDALQHTILTAAVTARPRELSLEVLDAREGAKELLRYAHRPVAFLFGRESAGLTSEEVSKCQIIIHIPANPAYPSLNLANAVQIITYELRMAAREDAMQGEVTTQPASFNEIESLYLHLEQLMIASNFLDPRRPKLLMQRIRRLFARARLEAEEVQILRGLLASLEKYWKHTR
ncbi:MAG: RNA methyltransferase [Nitrosomonas sp.]|nr:MAG: RNA methyltransferase [Nitrosomonas sp.]